MSRKLSRKLAPVVPVASATVGVPGLNKNEEINTYGFGAQSSKKLYNKLQYV